MAKRDYKSYNILDDHILEIEVKPRIEKGQNEIAEGRIVAETIEVECLGDIVLEQELSPQPEVRENKIGTSLNQKRFNLLNKLEKNNRRLDKNKKSKQKEQVNDTDSQRSFFIRHKNKDENSNNKELKNIELDNAHEEKQLHFPEYKKYYEQKERSALFRWLMLFAKIMLTLMLLPLIGFIAVAALCCIGAFLLVIMLCIGTGLVTIGGAAFMATQISSSVLALGICVGITSIALGGIIFIIFMSMMNWFRGLLKKYKKPRIKIGNKEEVR